MLSSIKEELFRMLCVTTFFTVAYDIVYIQAKLHEQCSMFYFACSSKATFFFVKSLHFPMNRLINKQPALLS